MLHGAADRKGAGRENARKSSDSHGFEEATFVTSPDPPLTFVDDVAHGPPAAPLHAPRFSVATADTVDGYAQKSKALSLSPEKEQGIARKQKGAPGALASHSRSASRSPGDTAVIDFAHADQRHAYQQGKPADTSLFLGDSAGPGPGAGSGSGGAAATAESAAAAAVAASTPPAVDPERWYQDQIDYVRTQVEQMESVDNQRGQEAMRIRSKWKRELFLLFEDPSSSPSAFVINVFVTFMIIFSAVLTTIETIPALRKGNSQMWMALELIIVAVFTLEFALRFLGHTDSWRQAWNHAKSLVTIVDALAIFPFYIELILRRDTSYEFRFTILRIFRLLRVFSAFKYSSLLQLSIEVMIVAIKRSSDALLAFLLFVTLTVLLFSTLMYFAERGTWDDERQAFLTPDGEYSKFSSIPAAAYYSIVTLTTTGFGDMVPTTFIGKLVSFPMMIAGILLIALPSIIVGRNFTQVWEAARKYRTQRSATRAQRIGDTLVDDDDDDNNDDSAHSSARASRRSRRQRLRRRGAHRRDSSISSFEGASANGSARSHMEKTGGYTNVYGGQSPHGVAQGSSSYERNADPIDALARKDSYEMQELASRVSEPETEERPGGYKQVDGNAAARDNRSDADAYVGYSDHVPNTGGSSDEYGDERSSYFSRRNAAGSRISRREASRTARIKGKERAGPASDGASAYIRITRSEWDSLNVELASLRAAVGSNVHILQAIAQHLSIPTTIPAQPGPPLSDTHSQSQ
ncbi:hypothetical protein LPJ56_001608 [Coemansia sp. RSA 2599]|nr:hypothetical protein LPJ56_001608 [Coemansia sp. RSA 2599]